jgi:DNA repair exonuclease SbcCD nuclease subunit
MDFPNVLDGPNVLWMHHGIQGCLMNDQRVDSDGLPISMFAGFDRVFCGHYHRYQTLGNLTYVGSPYQTRADESGQTKGFGLWDGKEFKFVEAVWGPRYHRYRVEEAGLALPEGARVEDCLRIQTAPDVDTARLAAWLTEQGHRNFTITPEAPKVEARLQVPGHAGLQEYAEEYVDQFSGGLNGGRLMAVFKEITED